MGWRRTFKYAQHRLVRLSDTTHKIALGLAIGCSISFTPFVGTHFIQAGILAYIFRANLVAAIIGTFVGNPWTFPFMWWTAISFGSFLFGLMDLPASTTMPDEVDLPVIWELIWNEPLRILLPWTTGGYLAMLICMPISYYIFYRLVTAAKSARSKARLRKVHKVASEITGPRNK